MTVPMAAASRHGSSGGGGISADSISNEPRWPCCRCGLLNGSFDGDPTANIAGVPATEYFCCCWDEECGWDGWW